LNLELFRNYCLSKKGVSEEFPFDENVLVFKVGGKIFALTDVTSFSSINLKCDPEIAVELREKYDAVQPRYHMNKKHWNTILIDGSIADSLIKNWVDNSYYLVASGLTKKQKAALDM